MFRTANLSTYALCLMLAVCFSNTASAQLDFSVDNGATGASGSDVNNLSGDPAHIYVGKVNTNILAIPKSALGLATNDNVDALTIPDANTPMVEELDMANRFWYFSVDPLAAGLIGTGVNTEFTKIPSEAMGDVFETAPAGGPGWGINVLAVDHSVIGLIPGDDQDSLDLEGVSEEDEPIAANAIYFSLAALSPSLSNPPGYSAGDILTTDGAGGFTIAIGAGGPWIASTLGIGPADDLDALFMDQALIPFFSVAPGGSGMFFPGNIYLPDGSLAAPNGLADLAVTDLQLGLLPNVDNLNSLDVLEFPFEGVDGDGDDMADWWEDKHGVDDPADDPDTDDLDNGGEHDNDTDPNDEDSDDDGYSDGDEVDEGTDPNDPADHPTGPAPVPLTWLWFALPAGLLVAAVVALRRRHRPDPSTMG
ncbi:hypothetical protein ACFL1X_08360 [Candidatus Hydrogenedentota bacterium]